MRAGDRDALITIEGQTSTQSPSGMPVITWSTLCREWAEIVELRGAERFAAQQVNGFALRTFRFPWNSNSSQVTTKHRIVLDGLTYDITDVRRIGRNVGIEVDCRTPSEEPVAQ